MFPLMGTAEVIGLLIVGGIAAPMFLLPTHRGGQLLRRRKILVRRDIWPAVSIEGEHIGPLARLQALFKRRPVTFLTLGPAVMRIEVRRLFRAATDMIPLDRVVKVSVKPWHPMYHVSLMGVVAFLMFVYGVVGRLTPVGVGFGLTIVGLCGALAVVQQTMNLEITIDGHKPIVLSFSTMPFQRNLMPEELHDQLCRAAQRIAEVATEARAQSYGQRVEFEAREQSGWLSRLTRVAARYRRHTSQPPMRTPE